MHLFPPKDIFLKKNLPLNYLFEKQGNEIYDFPWGERENHKKKEKFAFINARRKSKNCASAMPFMLMCNGRQYANTKGYGSAFSNPYWPGSIKLSSVMTAIKQQEWNSVVNLCPASIQRTHLQLSRQPGEKPKKALTPEPALLAMTDIATTRQDLHVREKDLNLFHFHIYTLLNDSTKQQWKASR